MKALTDPANYVEKSSWLLEMLMLELRKGFKIKAKPF
jgi:hypothetical protein